MKYLGLVLFTLVLFTSCFKKSDSKIILVDFDFQKKLDITIKDIIFDVNAHSGSYVTYADSTSHYGFTLKSNLKLLDIDKKTIKISAFINRKDAKDLGAVAFQIVNGNQESVFSQSVYITESNFVKPNEWTKIEGTIALPDDKKIYDPENIVKIFLFNTKNRILMDDLEISTQ